MRKGAAHSEAATRLDALPVEARAAAGETILKLYFYQLMSDWPTLLDLSTTRFDAGLASGSNGPLIWTPGPGHTGWSPSFRTAMTGVYAGFYRDDEGLMVEALGALGLGSAADLFRQHFGDGDQTAVTFSVEHFVSSFHDVFTHCQREGIRLDPDFLPLGLYLATLYDSLAGLGVPLDVRGAYFAAETAAGEAEAAPTASESAAIRSTAEAPTE